MPDSHKIPVFDGMSVNDAWGHIADAGLGNSVPEFVREQAMGRAHVWINVMVDKLTGKVVAAYWPDETQVDQDMLDEPVRLLDPGT